MPRLINRSQPRVPWYRRHNPSGQAVVTIGGKDFYLGPWKSKASPSSTIASSANGGQPADRRSF